MSRLPVILLSLIIPLMSANAFGQEPAKPNILIFYVDDMGWAQPNCYGGTLAPTPNMDALAAGGVKFTNGYISACICAPSRYGLMTGRYQARTGFDSNGNGRPGREFPLSEKTIANRLQPLGYTTGIVGKWHLGDDAEYLPAARGFDFSVGSTGNLGEGTGRAFYRGTELLEEFPGAPVTSPGYAKESVRFLEQNKDQPWFLYHAFNAVHTPHVASEKWLEKFQDLPLRDQHYAANIAEADEAIGTVMTKLRELNLEENTLIFLISDNGGAAPQAEMADLRGRKWFVWEGGIRVPFIVQWKGTIPAGKVSDEPVIQLDVLPTAVAAGGGKVQPDWQIDGMNLLPLLTGQNEKLADRDLFFRFGVQFAVRSGDWKLVKADKEMEPMLVNLKQDRGEQQDLSSQHPDKKQELLAKYEQWSSQMQPPRWEDLRWNGDENRKAGARKARAQKNNRNRNSQDEEPPRKKNRKRDPAAR